MKKVHWLIIFIVLVLGIFLIYQKLNHKEAVFCTMDVKECPDGSFVGRIAPFCEFDLCPGEKEGILVYSPKREEKIKSPLKIDGRAKRSWFFEGNFSAELYDENKNLLGKTNLTALEDWMKEDYVNFKGELFYKQPLTKTGILKFLSANPSNLEQNQKFFEMPVIFENSQVNKILLYYYNPLLDQDKNGNILCSEKGLVAIERELPISQTPLKDTINLLLKGKENLTDEDIKKGITTEFPLEGFSLEEVNLKPDGNLILRFNDPLNKTSGGSCRVNILWQQIEKTAKQFNGVKKVEFSPEFLFQP